MGIDCPDENVSAAPSRLSVGNGRHAPVIAVSPCRALARYRSAVRRSGGRLALEPGKDRPEDLKTWCHGPDAHGRRGRGPARYGEERTKRSRHRTGPRRVRLALAKEALAPTFPILAICRGSRCIKWRAAAHWCRTPVAGVRRGGPRKTPLFGLPMSGSSRAAGCGRLMQDELKDGEALDVNSGITRASRKWARGSSGRDGARRRHRGHEIRRPLLRGVQWHRRTSGARASPAAVRRLHRRGPA